LYDVRQGTVTEVFLENVNEEEKVRMMVEILTNGLPKKREVKDNK